MRITPKAKVTVVTIGRPSGIAATANETKEELQTIEDLQDRRLTTDGKHFEPTTLLPYTNDADDTNDAKRKYAEFLGQFVHRVLQGSPFFLHLGSPVRRNRMKRENNLHLASLRK